VLWAEGLGQHEKTCPEDEIDREPLNLGLFFSFWNGIRSLGLPLPSSSGFELRYRNPKSRRTQFGDWIADWQTKT
jgi:hypothetical protein